MARSFNGSSDEIICGSTDVIAAAANAAGAVTLSGWFNASSLSPSYSGIIGWGNGSNSFFNIFLKSSGQFAYYTAIGGSGTNIDPGTTTITTGTWHHVLITYVGFGAIHAYVDGVADGTSGTPAFNAIGNSGVFRIGNDAFASRFFGGSIADGALWSTVLSASEIAALASGIRPYRIRRSNLVGYWPLEGTASPEPDVIGGNNGTLTGTSQVANPYNYTTPKYGSRKFTAASVDSIAIGSINSGTAIYSFSIWLNSPLSQTYDAIINLGVNVLKLYLKSNGKTAVYSSAVIYDGDGAGTVSANTWTNWTIVCDNTNITSYLNTIQDRQLGFAVSFNNTSTFGIDGSGNKSDSLMADAALWNVALTTTEVAKLAAGYRPHQVRSSGLTHYWPFEGTASPELDMVAAVNGTLTGTSAGASPTHYQDLVGA